MADEFKIVASLDIPKSADKINKDIPKLEGQTKHLKIVATLNPALSLKNIQATLNKLNNNANIKIGVDTSGLNSIQGATQNITNSLKTVEKQAKSTKKSVYDINTTLASFSFPSEIETKNNGDEIIVNLEKTLQNARNMFKKLGFDNVDLSWADEAGGVFDRITAKVTDAYGVIQNFKFALSESKDPKNSVFSYEGSFGSDSGVSKLSAKIEETRAKYSRLLADFKNSNSAIESGLTQPIKQFEEVFQGLGNTSSINDVKNAFETLKQSASEITAYLDTTNSSFNKGTNAINNYKNMDNILKDMTTSFDNLVIKPEELKIELDGVKEKLIELQGLKEKEGGFTNVWAKKYREVNLELSKVKANIELAVKAEGNSQKADKNSAYQTQLKYLNRIKDETKTIISYKKKMVTAGDEENNVYKHEIRKAEDRIKYDIKQLEKKKLLTKEAEQLVNTYRSQIELQNEINSAKFSDKGIKEQAQQIKSYASQLDSSIKQLNSLQNSAILNKNTSNPQVIKTKQEIAQLLAEYQNLKTQMQGNITPEGLKSIGNQLTQLNARFNDATTTAKRFETELKSNNSADQLAQKVALLTSRIKAYRQANSKSEKMFGSQYDSMLSQLANPDIDLNTYNAINKQFQTMRQEINATNVAGKNLWQTLKEKAGKFVGWMSLTSIITSAWHEVKKMVTNVIELDNCLLELSKVSDLSATGLKSITKEAYEMGKQVGKTGTDVINAVTNFKRAGFDLKESMSFAKDALVLTNVAEGITDTGEAATALISIMKGYGDTSLEFSQKILDATNEVKLLAS